jgi:hypothetical protein
MNPWTTSKKRICKRGLKENGTTRRKRKARRLESWKRQRDPGSSVPSGSPWWGSFSRWLHCSPGFFSFSLRRFSKEPHPIARTREALIAPPGCKDYFETFVHVYDGHYSRQHGFWRPYVAHVIYRYLDTARLVLNTGATCITNLPASNAKTAAMSTCLTSPASAAISAPPAIRSAWWNSGKCCFSIFAHPCNITSGKKGCFS